MRFVEMLLGNLIIGFGISIGVLANLGIDPGMTFFYGIANLTGLSLGVATVLMNLVFLLPLLFFDRKRIGIATLVNMLLMGFVVEFFTLSLFKGQTIDNSYLAFILLVLGICIQSFGVALYSDAQMGQSPLDGIPNVILKVTKKGSYRLYRVIQDSSLVLFGFMCDVKIGIGTLVLMLLVGPLIHYFQNLLTKKVQLKDSYV